MCPTVVTFLNLFPVRQLGSVLVPQSGTGKTREEAGWGFGSVYPYVANQSKHTAVVEVIILKARQSYLPMFFFKNKTKTNLLLPVKEALSERPGQ